MYAERSIVHTGGEGIGMVKEHAQELDGNIWVKITTGIAHPQTLLLTRIALRLLSTLIAITFACIFILSGIHQFAPQTIRSLRIATGVMLLLQAVITGYRTVLFLHHYPRIKNYIKNYWYRTRARVIFVKLTRIMLIGVAIVALLAIDTFSIPFYQGP